MEYLGAGENNLTSLPAEIGKILKTHQNNDVIKIMGKSGSKHKVTVPWVPLNMIARDSLVIDYQGGGDTQYSCLPGQIQQF